MKLRRLLAALLVFVLMITNSPVVLASSTGEEGQEGSGQTSQEGSGGEGQENSGGEGQEGSGEDGGIAPVADPEYQTLSATNTSYMLWSAGVKVVNNAQLERKDNLYREAMIADSPYIDSLYRDAVGEFNKAGEEWVWFAFKVNAPKAGSYTLGISINYTAFKEGKTAHKIPLCVNGTAYTLTCTKTAQDLTTSAYLSGGENTVVVFFPMPQNAGEYTKAGWAEYYYICVDSIFVDSDLTVSAPTVAEVEGEFYTVINGGDENIVLANNFKDNGTSLGGVSAGNIRADKPTIATLATSGHLIQRWPFASVKVTAAKSGTYKIRVNATVNTGTKSPQLGLLVDGIAYSAPFTVASPTTMDAEVYMTAGEHVVTFFIPMPKDNSVTIENAHYPWMDYNTIVFGAGLSNFAKPTIDEIKAYLVAERPATDSSYLLWSNAMAVQTGFLDFALRDPVKADLPYIDSLYSDAFGQFNDPGKEWGWIAYKVNAPAAGTYTLGVNMLDCRNAPYLMPLIVNNQTYTLKYAATEAVQATAEVSLPAGESVVVVFMPMPQNAGASQGAGNEYIDYPWCNVESTIVDALLAVSKPSVAEVEALFYTTVNSGDENIVLANNFTDNTNTLGSGSYGGIQTDLPTVDMLPYSGNKISNWPFASVKVTAPSDGWYMIGTRISVKTSIASPQIGVLVNGTAYSMAYNAVSPTTADMQVYLKAGENVITFFVPMPKDHAALKASTVYYSWIDYQTFLFDRSLTVLAKPTAEEIKKHLDSSIYSGDNILLWSASVTSTTEENAPVLSRGDQNYLAEDWPSIDTLVSKAFGEFNEPSEEWSWFAYKVNVTEQGTYTLGVTTQGAKFDAYTMPMYVNGQVHTLSFSAKSQTVTKEVSLPAGEHVVVIFMPMPQSESNITKSAWNDYSWANVRAAVVDGKLTAAKPTVAEVEGLFYTILYGNDDNILSNKGKVNGTALELGGDLAAIREDLPNVNILPYAGNMLERWPFASIKVNAPADGTYNIKLYVDAKAAGSKQIGMLVDGVAYSKTIAFVKANETPAIIDASVALTAGEHVITFFSSMPANATSASNNIWNDYAWINFKSILLEKGLTVSKPTVADIKQSMLSMISAGDATVMLWSGSVASAVDSGTKILKCATSGHVRSDKPLIESLVDDAFGEFNAAGEPWNWFAYKVVAPQAGTYTLGVKTQNCNNGSFTIPVYVNGQVYTLSYSAKDQAVFATNVALAAGENVVVMFMPMPANQAAVTGTSNVECPWCNVEAMIVDSKLTTAKPTVAEVEALFYTKVNAGDETVILSNKFKDNGDTLGDVQSGDIKWDRTTIDLLPYGGNMLSRWPFVSVKVTAPASGTYQIRLDTEMNSKVAEAVLGALVDGTPVQIPIKSASDNKLDVELTLSAGEHVITFFMPMPTDSKQTVSDGSYVWINYNSLTFDRRLTNISKPAVQDIEKHLLSMIPAADKAPVLWSTSTQQIQQTNGIKVWNAAKLEYVRGDKPTVESLKEDTFGQFNAPGEAWPWVAYKVKATEAGTYTLGLKVQSCESAACTIPLYVNGTAYTLTYDGSSQFLSVNVALAAGENVVVVFLPMPAAQAAVTGTEATDYPQCDLETMIIDSRLEIGGKPTATEVEACFYTVIYGNDGRILSNKCVVNGTALELGGDLAAIREDKPNVSNLPYAGNMLERWPFASIKVNAPADGTYSIKLYVDAKEAGSKQIGMLVDGVVYSKAIIFRNNTAASIDATVALTAGEHVITFLASMPEKAASASGNLWNDYAWINFNSILLEQGLTVSKPTTAEIKAALGTMIHAGDENYVRFNKFTDGGNVLVDAKAGDLRAKKYYIEGLQIPHLTRIPHAAMEVVAAADGTYTVQVEASTNTAAASTQIAVLVDGKPQAATFQKLSKTVISVALTLTKGTHYLVFTSPMPIDAETAAATVADDKSAYPWIDFNKFCFPNGLTVSEGIDSSTKFVSVEDSAKISKNWSNYKDSDKNGSSDYLSAITDDMKTHRMSIDQLLTKGMARVPHISFTVTAPENGWYDVYAEVMANGSLTSQQVAMIVDGTTVYEPVVAGGGKRQSVGAVIPLTAGSHTIVITSALPATAAEAEAITNPSEDGWVAMNKAYPWFDFYGISVDSELTVHSGSANPLKDKSVLFVGDSITNSANSWASKIGTWNNMAWTNGGLNGATISDARAKIILHELKANANKSFSYVIMHGGINDAMSGTPIGTISDSWNVADFNNETFIGGLEATFYYAYENFPGAKLGYIINYATPNSKFGGFTANNDTKAYYDAAKLVCQKWGIPYIDLYEGTVTVNGQKHSYSYDILQVDTLAENFLYKDPREIHLSDEGYRVISPYIEAWMKTLTAKSSPIPAANSGKHIDTHDASKVLFSNFTPKNAYADDKSAVNTGLQDRVYTGMVKDQANIEILPYAKNMLGDWAFASIQVKVAKAGQYTVKVEMSAKGAASMGMLVDGQAYTLNYTKKDGFYEYMEQTVRLTEGIHYITFTAAMPETDNDFDGAAWNDYVWTNIASIVVDEGMEVMAAPTLEQVTSKLLAYRPFYTRVEAENGEYVIYNNYNRTNESSAIASGGQVVGGAWNSTYKQTFAEVESWMDAKGNAYIEYAVVAPADGEYEIRVGFLAGSPDHSVAKPYIAVVVNNTTYKVPFTRNWDQVDKAKLTVSLKKGLNIIRCSSITTDQEVYAVKGWVNHDFLDLDTRLTPMPHSSVTVEAERTGLINKFKVQHAEDYEKASNFVIGSADRKYLTSLRMTLDTLSEENLVQVPYFSITVNAPQDGYYPISVYMAADGRLHQSTIGVVVDGKVYAAPYSRTDKSTTGARVNTVVYLTEGEHVIAFTCPMPANAASRSSYSYYWCNFDYVELFDGLTYAKVQKMPATERSYARVEIEDHAKFNLNSNNGTAAGNASYHQSQTIAEMLREGIDGERTPYVELTVNAKQTSGYLIYLGVNSGMTQGNTWNDIYAQFVVEVNGKRETRVIYTSKKGNSWIVPIWVMLNEGENTIRLSHFSIDCQKGGTTWIDFDYIEMPGWVASRLTFAEGGIKLEAEDASYNGYSEYANASYSNGKYLGDPSYDDVDESDITFEKLDPADLTELPYVTYRVYAEKAGTYAVTVGFAAGMHHYPTEEIAEGATGGFAVIVNGASKQLIEYRIASSNAKMSRMVMLELQEGENEITFTTSLAEYIIDRMPRNDETYRMIWVDHDYLILSDGLSGMNMEADDYDVNDSDFDHGQINVKDPAEGPGEGGSTAENPAGSSSVSAIVWVLAGVGTALALFIILLIGKKRKKDQEEA